MSYPVLSCPPVTLKHSLSLPLLYFSVVLRSQINVHFSFILHLAPPCPFAFHSIFKILHSIIIISFYFVLFCIDLFSLIFFWFTLFCSVSYSHFSFSLYTVPLLMEYQSKRSIPSIHRFFFFRFSSNTVL